MPTGHLRAQFVRLAARRTIAVARHQFTFRHARFGIDGVVLKFGNVAGGQQRSVASEVTLRAFVGGQLGGNVGLRKLQVRSGGLLQLRLGTCVIGGIGVFLGRSAAGSVCGGFSSQADLEFGGIGLRFGHVKSGLGLLHFGLIRPGINLQEDVAFLDGSVVVDKKLYDIAGNLRGNGGDVTVHLRVVGGYLASVNIHEDCSQNRDHND